MGPLGRCLPCPCNGNEESCRQVSKFFNTCFFSARFEPFQIGGIHVIQTGFQPQAASGVGVDCVCRPGWVGQDCSQRGELTMWVGQCGTMWDNVGGARLQSKG